MEKIWANSADSHFLEPADLFRSALPARLAERMPWAEKFEDHEIVHVDGQTITRPTPKPIREGEFAGMTIEQVSNRPPGSGDVRQRLRDLDEEGIWGEVTFPSLGMWASAIRDPELLREGSKALNDWAFAELHGTSSRLVPTATLPLLVAADAVAELQRCASAGYRAAFLPTIPPQGRPLWNDPEWDPLWAAADETDVVVAFHIGTDGETAPFRGRGGAVMNYVETMFGGMRAATQLISAGVFDRHPDLKVLVAEGGATWVPYIGDKMNEAYRQHGMFVRPVLRRLPKEYMNTNVYASFQHDETAIATYEHLGYRNILFGSDYPHLEGTFGHTQKTLRELFDGVGDDVRRAITVNNFLTLFPEVDSPPGV